MAYPFAGFAAVKFRRSESPIIGTDSKWKRSPKRDQNANLGSATDSIVTLAIGSSTRQWEAWFDPDRYAAVEALIGVTDTLVDWTRPTPNARPAYLANVEEVDEGFQDCAPNDRAIRARLSFVSQ